MATTYNYDDIKINGVSPKGVYLNDSPIYRLQVNGKDCIHRFDSSFITDNLKLDIYLDFITDVTKYNYNIRADEYGHFLGYDQVNFNAACTFQLRVNISGANANNHTYSHMYFDVGTEFAHYGNTTNFNNQPVLTNGSLYNLTGLNTTFTQNFQIYNRYIIELVGGCEWHFGLYVDGVLHRGICAVDPVSGVPIDHAFARVDPSSLRLNRQNVKISTYQIQRGHPATLNYSVSDDRCVISYHLWNDFKIEKSSTTLIY